MRKYTNQENREQQALSIVQRMHWPLSFPNSIPLLPLWQSLGRSVTDSIQGQIDILEKRPRAGEGEDKGEGEGEGEGESTRE